ncbi:hypothetical protein [Nannocystis pusilla]|uniref:hypothetical protein n=1 Tax=Nannocystis pusilla TaxID=889268 RepID=UPI003BF2E3AB
MEGITSILNILASAPDTTWGWVTQSTFTDWLSAFGTTGAVVYTLYRDTLHRWIKTPKLTVTKGERRIVELNGRKYLVQPMSIANLGWLSESAFKTSVHIRAVDYLASHGKDAYEPQKRRTPVAWAYSAESQLDIPRGVEEQVEIFTIAEPMVSQSVATPPQGTGVATAYDVSIGGLGHPRNPGLWTISFEIRAENIVSQHHQVEIRDAGGWPPEEALLRKIVQAELVK